jgi:transposase
MRLVAPKTIAQQDLQGLHRIRQRLIQQRTALTNQIRSLLAEYGITAPRQVGQLRRRLPAILDDPTNELTGLGRELFGDLYRETDARSRWITELQRRRGTNRACVAVANKNARILWALMAKREAYRRAA